LAALLDLSAPVDPRRHAVITSNFNKAAAQDLRKRPLASYVLDLFDGNTRPSVRDGKSGADFSDR